MLELPQVRRFQWDLGNERKGADKYGVTQNEAEQVFFNEPFLLLVDERHNGGEARHFALGRTDDDCLLHVTFTLRDHGQSSRIIPARDMNRKEKARYEPDA